MSKPAKNKRPMNPRRMFSVKDQLAGKLGHNAFSLLLDQLNAAAAEKPKRRRRRRRKQVTA